jgi:hypothetical protein
MQENGRRLCLKWREYEQTLEGNLAATDACCRATLDFQGSVSLAQINPGFGDGIFSHHACLT